jgi:hypothetical protein
MSEGLSLSHGPLGHVQGLSLVVSPSDGYSASSFRLKAGSSR